MNKNHFAGLLAVLAVLGVAVPASAGIVIHEVRERNTSRLAEIASHTPAFGVWAKSVELESASSTELSGEGQAVEELKQIQAGLITEEEAAAGCGGASAATGPAGLLPLLVAGGALIRRRR